MKAIKLKDKKITCILKWWNIIMTLMKQKEISNN